MELFTSEGCSSCPPGDRLLADLKREFGDRVVPLAFHVEVWDHLGWKDPFAMPDGTRRHRQWSRLLNQTTKVYTPAMVVNGRTIFVGSDDAKAHDATRSALETPVAASVSLKVETIGATPVVPIPPLPGTEATKKPDDAGDRQASPPPGGETPAPSAISVDVRIEVPNRADLPERTAVLVALTQDGLKSEVNAGENSGKTLEHDGVVRWFKLVRPEWGTRPAEPDAASAGPSIASTSVRIDMASISPKVDVKRARIVAVVVDEGDWKVLGAASAATPTE